MWQAADVPGRFVSILTTGREVSPVLYRLKRSPWLRDLLNKPPFSLVARLAIQAAHSRMSPGMPVTPSPSCYIINPPCLHCPYNCILSSSPSRTSHPLHSLSFSVLSLYQHNEGYLILYSKCDKSVIIECELDS